MTVQILVRPWAGHEGMWWATVLPCRQDGAQPWPFSDRKPDWRDICCDCGAYGSPTAALKAARDIAVALGWRIRKITREGKA